MQKSCIHGRLKQVCMSEFLGCATISHTRIELLLSSMVAALLRKLYPHGVSTLKKHKPHVDRQKWCCTLSCRAAYNKCMQISEAVTATHMHVLTAATMNDDCILMCSCTHNHEWTGHISSYVVRRCLGQMGTHNRELIESDCHGCRTSSHETSHRLLTMPGLASDAHIILLFLRNIIQMQMHTRAYNHPC
jgi:hypothetical protein